MGSVFREWRRRIEAAEAEDRRRDPARRRFWNYRVAPIAVIVMLLLALFAVLKNYSN